MYHFEVTPSACSTSEKTDEALQRVRDAFDSAARKAEQLSETAEADVRDAIDLLARRIDGLRDGR